MKKILIFIFVAILSFSLAGCSFGNNDYLRIHIRANSNGQQDQAVKQLIKDEVVNFLTPLLAGVKDKNQAIEIVLANMQNICYIADEVLSREGFCYKSTAVVKKEQFPTRKYGDLVLYDGEYDALIVQLGEGKGDNWWCVVYPPLCFVGGDIYDGKQIVYKSKIAQFFDSLF